MLPDLRKAGATIDEWLFAGWTPDGGVGWLSGHRLIGARSWYWSALVGAGRPLLHLTEWDMPVRRDAFVVKAPEMWAEHHCVAPYEQWSIGNEAYFVALDDPDDALGRAYGWPTPTAMDLEWYSVDVARPVADGFRQGGVVHGRIDVEGVAPIELVEAPAWRSRRSTKRPELAPIELQPAVAHTGLRAAFAFPDGSISDWVLTPSGWCSRARAR